MIKKIIAIILLPIIILITSDLTKVKEVIHEDFTITSKTDNVYNIDKDLYSILTTYQENKNYTIISEYNITNDSIEYGTLCVSELICNEVVTDESEKERINENVGQVTINGSELGWSSYTVNNANYFARYIPLNEYGITNIVDNLKFDKDIARYNTSALFKDASKISYMYLEDYNYLYLQLPATNSTEWVQYLSQNPLTVTYELAVKNPNTITLDDTAKYYTINTYNNVTILQVEGPFDNAKPWRSSIDSLVYINGMEEITVGDIDMIESIGNYYNNSSTIWFIYPKGTSTATMRESIEGIQVTYELATPRLAETYEIDSIKYTYDPYDKSYNFTINNGYNEFKLLPDNTIKPITGPQLLNNTYSITYNVYNIDEPTVRNIVEIIPLIYIGVVVVYIFISRKD